LRELRDTAGLGQAEVAERIGVGKSRVSKLENGAVPIKETEAEALIELYELDGQDAEQLRQLGSDARKRLPPTSVVDFARQYVHLEAQAVELSLFYPDLIPGLLQTREYAEAVLRTSVTVAPTDVEEIARDRAARFSRLHPDAVVWAVIGEEALRRLPPGPAGPAQLRHLLDLAHHKLINLQVLPLAAGLHPAQGVSPFVILRLPDGEQSTYLEQLTAASYWTRPTHLRAYKLVIGQLLGRALSSDDSQTMIQNMITETER
jgi:transcriptional regulator with XRE-family HTH domain